ncbi:hypothetical protein ACR799_14290 [Clavibacter sepedonicus]|uniref:Uncharacterized protein n=1 Tax=Clavibacter sepedonicus TaxID=31964 RepID=B0RJ96_CLASE|nr:MULTISPECIES: hypothetical protein [Clavibacter]MBD5383119.1 hypothetical protein [Clavibacter sp.]OQJ45235.1 hypothetical protein B5P19_15320 [Clavibacter sepedonicus]OQJ50870.1 hypothetical protein B5P20_15655 [Clavibacter sepedonicus]UUK67331.1 hypothetical protein LRE50_16360 [Clavibacter sepedonicus]CAQ03286.1 hypothetical protein pCSL0043 [Clavibacter sepedonicus]
MSTPPIDPDLITQLRGRGEPAIVGATNAALMHQAADALQAVHDERTRPIAGHADVEEALQRLTNAAHRNTGYYVLDVVADAKTIRHALTSAPAPDADVDALAAMHARADAADQARAAHDADHTGALGPYRALVDAVAASQDDVRPLLALVDALRADLANLPTPADARALSQVLRSWAEDHYISPWAHTRLAGLLTALEQQSTTSTAALVDVADDAHEDGDDEDGDDERFCGVCAAGTTSPEHLNSPCGADDR